MAEASLYQGDISVPLLLESVEDGAKHTDSCDL